MSEIVKTDIKNFLHWYQVVYGSEIFLDGEIGVAQQIDLREIKKPLIVNDTAKKYTFDEDLIHQNNNHLKAFFKAINSCVKCSLSKTRTNFVFGMGNPDADLMFIGEAPGKDEDLKGLPFVGRAGLLLDKMLYSLKLKREQVYIANILKCRPPNNRDPLPDEVIQCEPYLKKQIELISPKVIIALGRISAQVLLKKQDSLSILRQNNHSYEDIPFIVTYHPAALLRNPSWKSKAWEDLKKIKQFVK